MDKDLIEQEKEMIRRNRATKEKEKREELMEKERKRKLIAHEIQKAKSLGPVSYDGSGPPPSSFVGNVGEIISKRTKDKCAQQ